MSVKPVLVRDYDIVKRDRAMRVCELIEAVVQICTR
jgi:hypothetical protein